MRSSFQDPLKTFNFIVEIDGFTRAGFAKASKLAATIEISEYREGGNPGTVRKSPGLTTYDDITLERGQIVDPSGSGNNDFYNWFLQCTAVGTKGQGDVRHRRTVSIVQLHRDGTEARRWIVRNAWPSAYSASGDFDAGTSGDSIEMLTLSHEGWELEGALSPPGVGESLAPSLGLGS